VKTSYPQYRVSQWIDTSEEAMNKPMATIIYGVQTLREKGGRWMHCANGTQPMHYDTLDKACEAIKALRAVELPLRGRVRDSDIAF
jgi:hypothetical protein